MSRGLRGLTSAVLLLALAAAVLVLRSQLMTVHEPVAAGSVTELVLSAETKKDRSVLPAMTGGVVDTCRLMVNAHVRATPLREVEPAVFALRLEPGLDEFDLRELRGCLHDLRQEAVRLDVRELRTVLAGPAS